MRSLFALRLIALLTFASFAVHAQEPHGKYPFTSTRDVTMKDLEGKEPDELKIMRNEVFARHGHTFKSDDLKQYFESQAWYKPTVADATTLLTSLEKKNVEFIKEQESRVMSTSDFDSFYLLFTKSVEKDDLNQLYELMYPGQFESFEKFKESYLSKKDGILAAVKNDDPQERGPNSNALPYGEYYNGVQYKFVRFEKHGCCWYIEGFFSAG